MKYPLAVALALAGVLLATATAMNADAKSLSHPLSKRELRQALLTIHDIPVGYSKTKPSKSSSDSIDSCPKAGDPLKGATVAKAEVDYMRGTFGPFLNEAVSQLRPGKAKEGMTLFRRLIAKCGSFTSKDKDGTVATGRFRPESFPKLGDDTIALSLNIRSKGNGLDLSVSGDVVVVRTGDVVTLVLQAGLIQAPPINTFETVVRRAIVKVQHARG